MSVQGNYRACVPFFREKLCDCACVYNHLMSGHVSMRLFTLYVYMCAYVYLYVRLFVSFFTHARICCVSVYVYGEFLSVV